MRGVVSLLVGVLLMGCAVSDGRAARALRSEGYTNIDLQGYAVIHDCPEGMSRNQEFRSS